MEIVFRILGAITFSTAISAASALLGLWVSWLQRFERNLIWKIGCVTAVLGVCGIVATIRDTLNSQEEAAASEARQSASDTTIAKTRSDLDNARAQIKKLQPKPFKERLRETIDKIDPTAFDSFVKDRSGAIILSDVEQRLVDELASLGDEPEGHASIKVEPWGPSELRNDRQYRGGVRVSIAPALLNDNTPTNDR